jgi:hypothetical protein
MMREWIIFALCLGVGGHVALGVVLHAPGFWPWNTAGLYGLLSGLAVYGLVQGARALWKVARARSTGAQQGEPEHSRW